jgi:hypothetical protein
MTDSHIDQPAVQPLSSLGTGCGCGCNKTETETGKSSLQPLANLSETSSCCHKDNGPPH